MTVVVTFLRAELYPDDTLLLAACAKYEAHVPEGCPYDCTVGWSRLDAELDDAFTARAVAAHEALTAPLADVVQQQDAAPVAVDLGGLGVDLAGAAADAATTDGIEQTPPQRGV